MSPSLQNRRKFFRAFTLVEVLVSVAILSLIVVMMANVLSQSSRLWQKGASDTDYRQRARAALEFITQDLKKAALPLDRKSQDSLCFEINPDLPSSPAVADSIFFQAPVAAETSKGVLAEVGYFVQWTGSKAALYRFFLNPSDSIYTTRTNLNSTVADVTDWSPFLFLDNVIGMWIKAYDKDGTQLALPYSSRSANALPATVEISLVMLDDAHAQRLTAVPANSSTPFSFVSSLPAAVRSGATTVSMKINLENMTGW